MTDKIAKSFGHETIRLPSYHCKFNPIELVWGALKNYVAPENADLKVETVEKLFLDKRDQPAKEFWENCAKHVTKIEDDYLMSDPIADRQVDKIIFEVGPDNTTGSDASNHESGKSFSGSSMAVSNDADSDTLDL